MDFANGLESRHKRLGRRVSAPPWPGTRPSTRHPAEHEDHAPRSEEGYKYDKESVTYISASEHMSPLMAIVGIALAVAGVALLNKVLKGGIWPSTNSMRGGDGSKTQIIELDEYEILDETEDQASEGYRVKIFDGDN
jgi:hypothetical protein